MNSQSAPLGENEPDWNDPVFSNFQYSDQMSTGSPFGANNFGDYNYINAAESPALAVRSPARTDQHPDITATATASQAQQSHARSAISSASAETSSQDSSSDSSSRRKRKNTSESPISDPIAESGYSKNHVKKEETVMDMDNMQSLQNFDQNFSAPMNNLSLDQDQQAMFDFQSAGSSPTQHRDYDSGLSLNAHMKYQPSRAVPNQFTHESPVGLSYMRDLSPNAYSTTDSDSQPKHVHSRWIARPITSYHHHVVPECITKRDLLNSLLG